MGAVSLASGNSVFQVCFLLLRAADDVSNEYPSLRISSFSIFGAYVSFLGGIRGRQQMSCGSPDGQNRSDDSDRRALASC